SNGGQASAAIRKLCFRAAPDFGDWSGSGAATTTTSSTVNSNLRLGATVDGEASVTPNATATADGTDEDGVTMPTSITAGTSVTIPVTVFNNNTAGKYLQAWIDFDNNGIFNDAALPAGERIYSAVTTANAALQTVNVTFTVPAVTSVGTQRGVRFRLSDNAATTPTSSGATGEIEDYTVTVACPTIAALTLPGAVAGTAYSQGAAFSMTPVASGFTWAATGLPSGFSLNSGTGLITGTTTDIGVFRVVVTATSGACTDTRVFPLKITGCGTTNIWAWNWDARVDTLDGNHDGGTWKTVSLSNNLSTGIMAINATLDVSLKNTVGLWLMIDNGPDPSTVDPNYSAIYLFGGNYYVTTYSSLPSATHTLGTIIASGTYTDTLVGSVRTFSFNLPVNTINAWAGGGTSWKGTSFPLDAQGNAAGNAFTPYRIGVWMRSFATGAVTYNSGTKVWTVNYASGVGTWDLVGDFGSSCCPLVIKPPTLPSGSVGTAYTTTTMDADWGVPAYSWTVSAGSLPTGLNLVSGVLSGTPTAAGTFNFTLRAQDSGTCFGTQAYTVNIAASLDFGDHIYGSLAASTASQLASVDVKIGTTATDAEATDTSDANANKDDTVGTDDEDLVMPAFMPTVPTTLTVPVTQTLANLSGATLINVFVDWNNDGDVVDAGETLSAQTVSANGSSNMSFVLTPPAGTATTAAVTRYLRIRVAEGGVAPAFAGASFLKGEVEDYAITISPPVDFGDFTNFGSASSNLVAGLSVGTVSDAEITATTNATATGDDLTG
ncbi:MAG: GEVED domain-containing protein, partial [Prosthecobacter sp.]